LTKQLLTRQEPDGHYQNFSAAALALTSDYRGGLNRSMQHHLKDLLFKDGVYEGGETVETFCHAEN
jgi:hypothetical protein